MSTEDLDWRILAPVTAVHAWALRVGATWCSSEIPTSREVRSVNLRKMNGNNSWLAPSLATSTESSEPGSAAVRVGSRVRPLLSTILTVSLITHG